MVAPQQAVAVAQSVDFGVAAGLLDYGLLGLLLLLSLILNGFMFRHILRQNDERVKDAREFAEKMHTHSNVLDRAIAVVDRMGAASRA
jgi:hypothetical protein